MESNVQIGKIVVTVLKATRGNVLHRRTMHRGDVYQLVGQLPDRHSFGRPAIRPFSTFAMSSIDMKSPATASDRDASIRHNVEITPTHCSFSRTEHQEELSSD
jgi:hypothetical protein